MGLETGFNLVGAAVGGPVPKLLVSPTPSNWSSCFQEYKVNSFCFGVQRASSLVSPGHSSTQSPPQPTSPSICLFLIHPSTCPSLFYLAVHSHIHSLIHPSSIYLSIPPSSLSIHPSFHPFNRISASIEHLIMGEQAHKVNVASVVPAHIG